MAGTIVRLNKSSSFFFFFFSVNFVNLALGRSRKFCIINFDRTARSSIGNLTQEKTYD